MNHRHLYLIAFYSGLPSMCLWFYELSLCSPVWWKLVERFRLCCVELRHLVIAWLQGVSTLCKIVWNLRLGGGVICSRCLVLRLRCNTQVCFEYKQMLDLNISNLILIFNFKDFNQRFYKRSGRWSNKLFGFWYENI